MGFPAVEVENPLDQGMCWVTTTLDVGGESWNGAALHPGGHTHADSTGPKPSMRSSALCTPNAPIAGALKFHLRAFIRATPY